MTEKEGKSLLGLAPSGRWSGFIGWFVSVVLVGGRLMRVVLVGVVLVFVVLVVVFGWCCFGFGCCSGVLVWFEK